MYILSPFVIIFIIFPMLLIVYLYLAALWLFVYRQRSSIINAFHERDAWEGYRSTVAALWSGHGWIWHGNSTCSHSKCLNICCKTASQFKSVLSKMVLGIGDKVALSFILQLQ